MNEYGNRYQQRQFWFCLQYKTKLSLLNSFKVYYFFLLHTSYKFKFLCLLYGSTYVYFFNWLLFMGAPELVEEKQWKILHISEKWRFIKKSSCARITKTNWGVLYIRLRNINNIHTVHVKKNTKNDDKSCNCVSSPTAFLTASARIYRPAFSWKQAQKARIQSLKTSVLGLYSRKLGL
jgi:hypothetical protein